MKPQVQALLLAAGSSTRFGSDKRFHPLKDGTPIILQALLGLQAAGIRTVIVVRPDEKQLFIELTAAIHAVEIVEADNASAGMGASIACGIQCIRAEGVLIALGDMPFIRPTTFELVADALNEHPLVVPTYVGRCGHPVGFRRQFFAELTALSAREGGKKIMQRYPGSIKQLALDDPGVLLDIDTLKDLPASSM